MVAMAAGSNIKKLEMQIREFHPQLVCVYNEEAAGKLKRAVADLDVKVTAGMEGLIEAAVCERAEIVVTAFVGMIGIRPTLEAMKAGKDIALANKETLVTAGHLVMKAAEEYGVKILPVDSEHSAIFQSLNGENKKEIDKILLTASGGPFRGKTRAVSYTHLNGQWSIIQTDWNILYVSVGYRNDSLRGGHEILQLYIRNVWKRRADTIHYHDGCFPCGHIWRIFSDYLLLQ